MVQRYKWEEYVGILPASDGNYIPYSDYTTLERENAELVEKVKGLEERIKLLTNEAMKDYQSLSMLEEHRRDLIEYFNKADGKMKALESENALLRKRLEPIDEAWNTRSVYTVLEYVDVMYEAIKKCIDAQKG